MTTSPDTSPHASLPTSIDQIEKEKQAAARAALAWVRSGMTLGLGTGTTARYFIQFLGERLRSERSTIEAVASSTGSEAQARDAGIRVIAPRRGLRLDLTVDGADEIAPDLSLIKGHGGALLREKVLAQASRYFLVIADSSKRVRPPGRPLAAGRGGAFCRAMGRRSSRKLGREGHAHDEWEVAGRSRFSPTSGTTSSSASSRK